MVLVKGVKMFVRDLDLKDVVTFAGKEYLVSTVQLTFCLSINITFLI